MVNENRLIFRNLEVSDNRPKDKREMGILPRDNRPKREFDP